MNIKTCEESGPSGLVKSFLQSCLQLLKDEKVVLEIQNLVDRYDWSMSIFIMKPTKHFSATNKAVHQISKYIETGREMRLNANIGDYDMDEVILDLGFEVNVLTRQTWQLMGKPNLRYSPIQLRLVNQQRVNPMGRLSNVPIDIDGVWSLADFEVIEIIDDSNPFPALLGIDWAFDNLVFINLKKK